jgi:hypothetical protein
MSRVVIERTPDALVARIPVKRDEHAWLLLLWGPLWLAVGPMVLYLSPPGGYDPVFLILTMLFWLAVAIPVVVAWPWNAAGQEIVTLAGGMLNIRREIMGRGTTRQFPLAAIRGLNLDPHDETVELSGTPLGWGVRPSSVPALFNVWVRVLGLGGASIVFEHDGMRHGFGLALDGEEADGLLLDIEQYMADQPEES